MATVRLVESLNKEILHEANKVFDQRIVSTAKPPVEFSTEAIYELWLDSEVGLRADVEIGVKRGWLFKTNTLKILRLANHGVDIQCLEYAAGVSVPHNLARIGNNAGIKLKGVRADELYEIYKDWQETYKRVCADRDKFAAEISNLLARHKTLKQALGEWPALWDFIPLETKNKHNEDKAKARAKEQDDEKPDVDLDVLNGAVVTAKILKAGIGS